MNKITKSKLKEIIREEIQKLSEAKEIPIDDIKFAGLILGKYTQNKSFGKLKWVKDGNKFSANITNLVKKPFDLIFKELKITCDAGWKMKNGDELYYFSFGYTHPGGGSNGKEIGVVRQKPDGNWTYKGE